MNKRLMLAVMRWSVAFLTALALMVQLVFLAAWHQLDVVNYFSYYTNLSNVLACIVLTFSGFYIIRRRKSSLFDDMIRASMTLYMIITGIVYIVLLRDVELGLLMPWVNIVLHIITPLAVILDWIYQPPRTKFSLRQIGFWLIFPAAYLTYTLVRGSVVHWYPYPFLNPAGEQGYVGVAVYCIGILAVFIATALLLVFLGRQLKRHVV